MMQLRGVAFDLDGTLLQSDHSVSPTMMRVLGALDGRGLWFTTVSARPPRSVAAIAESIGAPGPWVALNGAIVGAGRDRILSCRSLIPTVVEDVIDQYRGQPDVSLNVYTGFDWLVDEHTAASRAEADAVGFEPTLLTERMSLSEVGKILLIVQPGNEPAIRQELAMLGETVISVSQPGYVELTHAEANKAGGLRVAAASAGLSIEQLMAAGDGENDLPMLRACGWPVTMAHAGEALKRIAKVTLGSNDDDSLARYVEELFLDN